MIWKKIIIETLTEATDIVASVLFDNGIIGAEIEDNQNLSAEELKRMYVDIPVIKIDDGISKVSFYVAIKEKGFDNIDKLNLVKGVNEFSTIDNSYKASDDNIFTKDEFDKIFSNIINELNEYKDFMDMGTLKISYEELDDNIFLNKWKENFKRLVIDDIVICPSWENKNDNESLTKIFIEPGNAFGTGQHATTKLCVRAIKKFIKNCNSNISVLDIGCGSGILGLVSKKLGASNICLIDIDKDVEFNLLENFKLNGYEELKKLTYTDENGINKVDKLTEFDDGSITYGFGNIIDDFELQKAAGFEKYDIVVANILAPVICSLLCGGKVDRFVKSGGYFICSGILKEKQSDVEAAIKENGHFKVLEILEELDWICIICLKNA